MSGEGGRARGRPAGPSEETLQRRRTILSAYELGSPVPQIAARLGLSMSVVWDAIAKARAERGATTAPAVADGEAAPQQPKRPKPLRRGTLMERAYFLAFSQPAVGLGPTAHLLWSSILVAIHENGDGERLYFGDGQRFGSRDELAVMLPGRDPGAPEVDAEAIVDVLIKRGRLMDVDGEALAAPVGLGVRLGENARGEMVKPRARKRAADLQQPLAFRPTLVGGRDVDAADALPGTPGKMRINPESDSGKNANKPGVAGAVVVVVEDKEIQGLKDNNNNNNHASATPEKIGIFPESDSGNIPADAPDAAKTEIPSSPEYALAVRLKALTPPVRPPSPKDIGWVLRHKQMGYSDSFLCTVVSATMAQPGTGTVSGLDYFTVPVRDAATAASGAATAATPAAPRAEPAPRPLEPEADIPGDGLDAQWQKVRRAVPALEAAAWFNHCRVAGLGRDGELVIECPSRFIADHNRVQHSDRLTALWRKQNPAVRGIEFSVARGPPAPS